MDSTDSYDGSTQNDSGPAASAMEEAAAYAALSRIALSGRPLDQTLEEVAVLAQRALPETPEASVTLLTEDQARTAAFSGQVALQLDERQYEDGYGPCLDAAASGGVIHLTIDDPDSLYPDYRRLAHQQGVTHSSRSAFPPPAAPSAPSTSTPRPGSRSATTAPGSPAPSPVSSASSSLPSATTMTPRRRQPSCSRRCSHAR